uniref:Uncharacterized protein isoform X2 n=1 Tax=Nicotiana tabacum TaxID=4097 RepID=A0A1S4DME4_TOBAC|nr:PREDICTED: uncharacterized protein LOC107831340 isoform X2 [Nicotiana tabacum]
MRINPPMLLQINRSYLKLVKGDNFPRYCFQRWFGADYSHTETPTTKCFISCSHFIFIHGIQLLPVNSNFNEFWQKMAADSTWVSKIILYSFWQSSCSWRVRFALNLKEFEKLNPLHYVPVLVDGDVVISDSYAILLAVFRREVSSETPVAS